MIETLLDATAQVPGALLVILLLGGPTAVWIIYGLLNARTRKRPGAATTGLLWVCASCRSANDVRRDLCYRCGVAANVDALEIIEPDVDPTSGLRPVMSQGLDLGGRPPVAVGPGKASTQPAPVPEPALIPASTRVSAPAKGSKAARPRRTAPAAGPAKPKGRAAAEDRQGSADGQA